MVLVIRSSTYYFNEQPFVDVGHPLHQAFPPRHWALLLPIVFFLLVGTGLLTFVALVMVGRHEKEQAQDHDDDGDDFYGDNGMMNAEQTSRRRYYSRRS
jgi:hypothetical protein